jgi:outer membrane protein TolC
VKRLILILVFLFSPIQAVAETKAGLTLQECYELAMAYSDQVAISKEEINLAKARFTQVLGEVLPQVTYQISEFLQDPADFAQASDAVGRTFTQLSRTTGAFNFQQILFRGFQAYQGLKIARLDQRRSLEDKQNVERLLFQDVAISFYTIALVERDIHDTKMIIDVVQKRVGELRRRVELGKSREGELTQEQALLALLQADLERKIGQKIVAYEMMSFLTGKDPMPPIAWSDPVSADRPLAYYLEQIPGRPDLEAARTTVEMAERNIKVARGNFLPRGDLEANIYTNRPGFQSNILWDTQIVGEVPLLRYQNFGTYQAAKAEAKQSQYEAENLLRVAQREVKEAYEKYQNTQAQYRIYRKAVDLAYKNFTLQNADFNLGRANNLDVLTAQRTWLDALDQKNRSEVQSWLDWTQLQIASGMMP